MTLKTRSRSLEFSQIDLPQKLETQTLAVNKQNYSKMAAYGSTLKERARSPKCNTPWRPWKNSGVNIWKIEKELTSVEVQFNQTVLFSYFLSQLVADFSLTQIVWILQTSSTATRIYLCIPSCRIHYLQDTSCSRLYYLIYIISVFYVRYLLIFST